MKVENLCLSPALEVSEMVSTSTKKRALHQIKKLSFITQHLLIPGESNM